MFVLCACATPAMQTISIAMTSVRVIHDFIGPPKILFAVSSTSPGARVRARIVTDGGLGGGGGNGALSSRRRARRRLAASVLGLRWGRSGGGVGCVTIPR